jgi:type II secretory pathway pseudopilin PulG
LAAGFTIPEVMLVLIMGSIVVASIIGVIIPQYRDYDRQRDLADLRGSLGAAMATLVTEFRPLSAAEGDLLQIAPTSFTVRSVQGVGVVCDVVEAASPTYGIAHVSGSFSSAAGDSAVVYAHGAEGVFDDGWSALKIQAVASQKAGFECAWGGSGATVRLELAGDTAGIGVGSALREFRRTEFALFSAEGRWWLGRKQGSSGGYELLAGPMASPSDSGLVLLYSDRDGNSTTVASDVASVEISLRGETVRKLWKEGVKVDSLRTKVSLRG